MSSFDPPPPPPGPNVPVTADDGAPTAGTLVFSSPDRRSPRALGLVPAVILALVLSLVRVPYFVEAPDLAHDVEPLIHLQGTQVFPSRGHFLLMAVTLRLATVYDLVRSWRDPALAVVPERLLIPPGQTQEQEAQVAVSQMDTSKIDAAIVALSGYAGYPDRHRPGALVESVVPGTPAAGRLFAGDVIVAVDGDRIEGPDDVAARIREAGAGHPLHLTVRGRPDGTAQVTVTPARFRGVPRPIIGVSMVDNFPFPLTIESDDIGGPSAGLMWTLGLIDLLTPGDLTGGRVVAGTGEIGPDGAVSAIGAVQQKVVAAERAGARVFFVPVDNYAEARVVAKGITLVRVRTYLDALRYLHGPEPEPQPQPSPTESP